MAAEVKSKKSITKVVQPPADRPFCIALTGGIASGKTAVSNIFSELGVPIVDTDIIAREVVEPGSIGLQKVSDIFGSAVLDNEGKLKRSELRSIITHDPQARYLLDDVLHPLIYQRVLSKLKQYINSTYVLIVVPLLIETGMFSWVERVLLVDVSVETQLKRLLARDNMTEGAARKLIATQASRKQRQDNADDIINNEDDLQTLQKKCIELHEIYQSLSKSE